MNALITRANSARRETIRVLENAVRQHFIKSKEAFTLPTALESELTAIAPRPTSLGFSEHDLTHFSSFYASLTEHKMEAWQSCNTKVLRQEHPIKTDVAERDRLYQAVKIARTIMSVLTKELIRRENLRLEDIRESEAAKALMKKQAEEQAAEMAEVKEELAVINLRAPHRKSHSTPKKREVFSATITSKESSNPFEALKGEVTSRSRENWQSRPVKKSEVLDLTGCSDDDLTSARMFAQKMGTDEVMDLDSGVIRMKKLGNSVRYEYFGA